MANFYNANENQGGDSNGFFGGGDGFSQPQQQQPPGGGNFAYGQQQPWSQSQSDPVHGAQPYGQYQQQQQQQPGIGFFSQQGMGNVMSNPNVMAAAATAMSGGLNSDTTFNMAGQAAEQIWQTGAGRIIPGLETLMLSLRRYFAVDNYYVKAKILKVLFPFRSKTWKRHCKNPQLPYDFALPSADDNAPDLYLPSMTLITYVLLCALCYGTAGKFDPEVIPDVTTKCFVTQILEVLAIRFGYHLMQAPVPILDLFSYTGYKYVGLSINMFVGMLLGHLGYGHRAYYVTFLWTASAIAYFMLKTMANNIPTVTAASGPKREVMVVAFAGSQLATMWFVSQTKFL